MGPTSVEDLTTFWPRCWQEIPQAEVDALVRGWQGRRRRCVRLRGAIAGKRRVAKKASGVFGKVTGSQA